jgi:two-component system sensor histidine kinase BarA
MSHYPVVLYVEDDPQSCEIMELLLTADMGLEHVNIFRENADFLERVRSLDPQPDIFLLDIHVKPYTGFEMLEMLRQDAVYRNTPVIALTASVMNEEVLKLKTAGFNGVIAKPLDLETFPTVLQRILKGETVWYVVS